MHKVHTPIGGRKDGRTEGRKAKNYVPPLFFEKAGRETIILRGGITSVMGIL